MSQSETASPTGDSKGRVRRLKACKQCHGLKVRCTPVDENDPASPCVRCVNSNKVCEMDLDQPRKRKKRSTNKEASTVAELREQVRELQEKLLILQRQNLAAENHIKNEAGPSPSMANHSPAQSSTGAPDVDSPLFISKSDLEKELALLCEENVTLREITEEIRRNADRRQEMLYRDKQLDVVSLGIISMDEAELRLRVYRDHLYAANPLVALPSDATVESMIANQPFMFNTIMSITCMGMQSLVNPDVSLALENQAVSSVVTEVMVAGKKTVELLKCLILLSLWYNSPELFKLRRYHILNNVAVTLLHDLGIVNRASFDYSGDTQVIQKKEEQYRSLEYRALIMILYFSTVNICLILRRAVFVKWTPYVDECCELLEKYGDQPYKELAIFSKLNYQLERIHHIVHAPENCDKPKITKYVLSELQTNLATIKAKLKPEHHQYRAYYYSVEAYLYQPNFANFNLVSTDKKSCTQNLSTDTLVDVAQCTTSCLYALDEFSMLLSGEVSALPLFYSSRVIYTAGMLLRLRYLILSLPSHIEKELVPRYAIVAIQKLSKQVSAASKMFPANYFLKKMMLILQLFIQTYVTQVLELLRHSETLAQFQVPSRLLDIYKHDMKDMIKLANVIYKFGSGANLTNAFEKTYPPAPYLDMLSSLATGFRQKKGNPGPEAPPHARSMHKSMSLQESGLRHPGMGNIPDGIPHSETATSAPHIPPLNGQPELVSGVLAGQHGVFPNNQDQTMNSAGQPHFAHMVTDAKDSSVYTQPVPPVNHNYPNMAPNWDTLLSKDDYFIDDEFWSNLLSTDSNALSSKFHFAQDEPMKTENLLFMN